MATEHDSHDASAPRDKDEPTHRGRDARKGVHDEYTRCTDNKPPEHGGNTHRDSLGYYVERAPKGTPLSEIQAAYKDRAVPAEWHDRQGQQTPDGTTPG